LGLRTRLMAVKGLRRATRKQMKRNVFITYWC
jgi:hypothetical protein